MAFLCSTSTFSKALLKFTIFLSSCIYLSSHFLREALHVRSFWSGLLALPSPLLLNRGSARPSAEEPLLFLGQGLAVNLPVPEYLFSFLLCQFFGHYFFSFRWRRFCFFCFLLGFCERSPLWSPSFGLSLIFIIEFLMNEYSAENRQIEHRYNCLHQIV